jgi:hypothetical protein
MTDYVPAHWYEAVLQDSVELRAEVARLTRLLDAFHNGTETRAEVERLKAELTIAQSLIRALEPKP